MSSQQRRLLMTVSVLAAGLFLGAAEPKKLPPPSWADLTGTWVAVESYGRVWRLDLEEARGSGRLRTTIGDFVSGRRVKTALIAGYTLTIRFDDGSSLEAKVFRPVMTVRFGVKRLTFLEIGQLRRELKLVGLSVESTDH